MTCIDCDLKDAKSLSMVCDDCGRRKVWGRNEIARAQVRYGVRTVVQVGSKLRCQNCIARGDSGRNMSVYVNETPPPARARDTRGLPSITSITCSCLDCGAWRLTLDKSALEAMPAVKNVDEVWRNAYCPLCREAGAKEPNICFEVDPPLEAPTIKPVPVKWSTKEVFTEDRSDPFPTLPRRRLIRDVETQGGPAACP